MMRLNRIPQNERFPAMKISRVIETCLYVDDLSKAQEFYTRVLGLEIIAHVYKRHIFFKAGDGVLLLFLPEETSRPDGEVPPHGTRGMGHVAFAMDHDEIQDWRQHLRSEGVEIEREIDWPSGDVSLYFRDPANNSLELVTPTLWGGKQQ
jgi:catechol 2,3-dioxygenase-like lactoylglutathione lyase family enzyme